MINPPSHRVKVLIASSLVAIIAFVQTAMMVQLFKEGEPLPYYLAAVVLEVIGLLRVVEFRFLAFGDYYLKDKPQPKKAIYQNIFFNLLGILAFFIMGVTVLPFRWFVVRFFILFLLDIPLSLWLNVTFIRSALSLKDSILSITAFYLLIFTTVYLALHPSEQNYYLFVLAAFATSIMISFITKIEYQKNKSHED